MIYQTFQPHSPVPGAMVVRLYPTGGRVRGYVREMGARPDDDAIFPGEEMEPEAAFELARSHSRDGLPILVELVQGANWNPAWGELETAPGH